MASVRSNPLSYSISIFLLIKMAAQFCRIGAVPYVHPAMMSQQFSNPPLVPWGIRGGSTTSTSQKEKDDNAFYSAIGFQVVGKTDSLSKTSSSLVQGGSNFMLLKGNRLIQPSTSIDTLESNNRIWNGDEIAVECLAIACDIMVLVVVVDTGTGVNVVADEGAYLDVKFTRAMERGMKQRANSGMKSSLLVLLVSPNETTYNSELPQEKDRLLLRDLSNVTPETVSSLNILSLENPEESSVGLETTWKEIIKDNCAEASKTTSSLVDEEAFPLLLHDIYEAKGGKHTQFTAPLKRSLVTGEHSTDAIDSPIKATEKDLNVVDVALTKEPDVTESPSKIMEGEYINVADETPLEATESTSNTEQITLEGSTRDDSEYVSSALDGATPDEQQVHAILMQTQNQIRDLEAKQEQMWLAFSSADMTENSWHNEFGPEMDRIIDQVQTSIQNHDQAKVLLFTQILPHLKELYEHHLQFLREQYGKQYEAALETTADSPEEYQKGWKEAAGKITSCFREAAQSAIPIQCREGGQLRDADFDYVPILEGLLQDMMQATEEQEELLGITPEENEDEDEDGESSGVQPGKKRKGPTKWYHKVAAKAFVFGVNYFQGWLAYQGIKRAAAQRDLHLPKFPLF